MSQSTQTLKLADEVRGLLSGLRWRIRAYVWLEGIFLALIWLAATFWCGLAIDYMPVLVGASELPRPARAVLLTLIATVLAWILYRWILRRTFVRLHDRNMALLIERRFGSFRDSLLTSVELSERGLDDQTSTEMLSETFVAARQQVKDVKIGGVLNLRPLLFRGTIAAILVIPVVWFYTTKASAWEILVNRLYLLKDQRWPRNARIEVVGLEPVSVSDFFRLDEPTTRAFRSRQLRVARGSSVKLVVRADATARVIPELCTVQFRIDDGNRGSISMNRVGRSKDGFQYYEYSGAPFSGVLAGIQFDVIGYDHRASDYRIEPVDAPEIVTAQLECKFPDYMVDEANSLWLPRTVDITPGLQVPRGTLAVLKATANKGLQRILVRDPNNPAEIKEVEPLEIDSAKLIGIEDGIAGAGTTRPSVSSIPGPHVSDRNTVLIPLGVLGEAVQLELMLHDSDDVMSNRAHRVYVTTIRDQAPKVNIRMQGIGTMVTPDVVLPLRGQIEDDYGISQSWLSALVNGSASNRFDFAVLPGSKVETEVDYRELRAKDSKFQLNPKDKLILQAHAQDRCSLDGGPNEGFGPSFELEVVTPEQLLTALEGRELALRRRLEQIIDEMTETRDSLVRVRTVSEGSGGVVPEDAVRRRENEPQSESAEAEAQKLRLRSLRILRTQRAVLQAQKSAQETLGVAAAIRDIRDELSNNRVDTQDRKQRLSEQIAEPLQRIGDVDFVELDQVLTKLSVQLEKNGAAESSSPETDDLADQAVNKNNHVIRELQKVLSSMLDLESYNELLDIVRSLIAEQESLSNETKKQQKKQALDLLK